LKEGNSNADTDLKEGIILYLLRPSGRHVRSADFAQKVYTFIWLLFQGPKFVSDEEIERIKAKIEEDNKAIAALDIKNERKYGEIAPPCQASPWDPPVADPVYKHTTIMGYGTGSPSLPDSSAKLCTTLSELRSEVRPHPFSCVWLAGQHLPKGLLPTPSPSP
jgi:hypothetical protein